VIDHVSVVYNVTGL